MIELWRNGEAESVNDPPSFCPLFVGLKTDFDLDGRNRHNLIRRECTRYVYQDWSRKRRTLCVRRIVSARTSYKPM